MFQILIRRQLVSHTEIHRWQEEFSRNTANDHQELVDYLSEIQHSQAISTQAQQETTAMVRQVMTQMQSVSDSVVCDRCTDELVSS